LRSPEQIPPKILRIFFGEISMTWEDIIVKGPFRSESKIRRQMDKGKLKIKNRNISEVGQQVNKIINEFRNDPEFQRVGQFGIKLANNPKGKDGLMFYTGSLGMDNDEFLELAVTHLNKLEYKAEKQGNNAILVTNKNAVQKQELKNEQATVPQDYDEKLIAAMMKRGSERPNFGFINFDNARKLASFQLNEPLNVTTEYRKVAMHMRDLLKEALAGTYKHRDFNASEYLNNPDSYVRDAQTQSSFPVEKIAERIGGR